MEQLSFDSNEPSVMPKNPKSLVIVEDDPTMCHLWTRLFSHLSEIPHRIFSSPLKALASLKDDPADILLTDLVMPEMSGLELIGKTLEKNPRTKIIVTSAYPESQYEFAPLKSFIHFIRKPYKNVDFLRELLLLFMEEADEISQAEMDRDNHNLYVWDL